MAGSVPARPRRGPAPIASFDHDNSDESSPESKAAARLPEIREQLAEDAREQPEVASAAARGRALSAPGLSAAPRIDISRASSSSQQDSRDSSPELALFAAGSEAATLGFREDGALDLRSSTEELSFLEPAAAPPAPAAPAAPAAAPTAPAAPAGPAAAPGPRRHSRKDSQGSEAALLGVSGRTSRLSSVGSACSAASHVSHVSHLSVVSGASRSPSPHRMLLETSFCGPRPLDAEPELSAAAVQGLLGLAERPDRRDQRRVRTEAAVEAPPPAAAARAAPPAPPAPVVVAIVEPHDEHKKQKETQNRAKVEERRSRPKLRREPSEPEVYRSVNRTKNVVRIRLKPKEEYDETDVEEESVPPSALDATAAVTPELRKPGTLELRAVSPSPGPASRKSSFCSLFRSRETIASPESPLRRKRSLTDSRSRSRERSHTPTSARLRGSVLALFRAPRRSSTPRAASPRVDRASPSPAPVRPPALLYYEEAQNGVIHIPLRTPPDEAPGSPRPPRPASAPQPRGNAVLPSRPTSRTVLPDGSIIIPLHSPTELERSAVITPLADTTPRVESPIRTKPDTTVAQSPVTVPVTEVRTPTSRASTTTPAGDSVTVTPLSPPATTDVTATVCTSTTTPDPHRSRRERIVFTTHVGSTEQVFSTQLSITKTPSVTSEISTSLTFPESDEVLRDTRIGSPATPAPLAPAPAPTPALADESSESEAGSEVSAQGGSEAEVRGLVVQESFEELPYVATTLPQERPLALPMVPVRERGGVRVAAVQRPRPPPAAAAPAAAAPAAAAPAAPAPAPAPAHADKLHIRLPRRPRPASAPDRPDRRRTISGADAGGPGVGGGVGGGVGPRSEWVEFAEGSERRRAARRIQTLPARSYVTPEDCRCRCHNHNASTSNGSSPECEVEPQQDIAEQSHRQGGGH